MKKWSLKKSIVLLLGLFSLGALPDIDPTRPPNDNKSKADDKDITPTTLILSAVFIYPSYSAAIINGNVLKVGESIGEYTITRIDANTVELSGFGGKKENLQLITRVTDRQDG